MNIEGSGLWSLLSPEGMAALKQAVFGEEGQAHEFSDALLEEIERLQGENALAALFGKHLPLPDGGGAQPLAGIVPETGDKAEIDLEGTLETLRDILQHISMATSAVSHQKNEKVVLSPDQARQAGFEGLGNARLVAPALGSTEDESVADLIQNENAFNKPGMQNPVIQDKQAEKIAEASADEAVNSLPKVAADIAQINRRIVAESRAELPSMSRPVDHPEWSREFGERILWMQSKSMSGAQLRLNPPHLGPISIRIEINQDQASIAFTAHHAAVRDAIEAAIPRLREMLGSQQLNLADVDISRHGFSDQAPSQYSSQTPQERREDFLFGEAAPSGPELQLDSDSAVEGVA
ncbi:MAG: flagellar hook-length control protein FliK, partial [Gammaproteobacteria bacterium]